MNGPSQHLFLSTRGTALRGRVLESVVLGYSLIAGAFHSNPPSLAGEPKGLARLGIAVGTGMLALAIRSRLTRRQDRSPSTLVADLVTVYGCIVLSQVVLACLWPNLTLPGWAPTQGGFVGVMLFAATRALLAAFASSDEILPASNDASKREIANTWSRRRTQYAVSGSIALALALAGLAATSMQVRIAASMIAVGSAYLLIRVGFARRAASQDGADDYSEARCKAVLQGARFWYYGALFPASLVALSGSKVYLYWIPIVILLFAEANQSAVASLWNGHHNRFADAA